MFTPCIFTCNCDVANEQVAHPFCAIGIKKTGSRNHPKMQSVNRP